MYELAGLTQRQLADAAGVSDATIQRAVAAEECVIKRSTAIEIFRVLRDASAKARRPLPEQMFRDFAEMANLPASMVTDQAHQPLVQLKREAVAHTGMPADVRRCHEMLADLIQQQGAASVLKLLEAATTFAAKDDREGRTVRVVNPPVQKDGYVEQVIAEYEHRSGENESRQADAKPKPRARRTGQ